MVTENYTRGFFVRALERLCVSRGVDVNALWEQQGLQPPQTWAVDTSFDAVHISRLLDAAVTTLQDPVLGLNLARFVDYPHFGALGLCLATGVSVQQLLHRMVRYH
ncbi:MAG TPA: AraC family transcriptional regulator ligand-binding domain-containing protein, partial [Dongiaceae bacterium]|nr:AraC family transcriptional regulator ligand-binding domain-containing protein [Dongiaceae bacterium]